MPFRTPAGTAPPRRLRLAAALLFAGAAALAGCTPAPAARASEPRTAPAAPQAAAATGEPLPLLRLDALEAAAERPGPVDTRNPFRFPTPRDAAPAAGARAPRAPTTPDPQTPPPGPDAPPPPADPSTPPETAPLRVIGVVDAPAGPVAVATDGRRVAHGRVDDVLLGRYRLVAIGPASVTVEHLPGPGRYTLPRPRPDDAPQDVGP